MRSHTLVRNGTRLATASWAMLGAVFAGLLCFESVYRVQANTRRTMHSSVAARSHADQHPYQGLAWYPAFESEENRAAKQLDLRPFVGYRRRPFVGQYVNITPQELRRTVQATTSGASTRDVFVFGGSTTWGTGQRDSLTLASQLVADLADRGIRDVHVTNFGQSGYVSTQEVIELTLQLRGGARPAVVVFCDGANDVSAAVQAGRAGIPLNEFRRARDFHEGQLFFRSGRAVATDVRALEDLTRIGVGRLQFIDRLWPTSRVVGSFRDDSLADDIARTYLANIELVDVLARTYGFSPFYFWHPTLASTRKRLSPFEARLWAGLESDSYSRAIIRIHRRMPERLRALSAATNGRLVDLATLFDTRTESVFIDESGHETEAATGLVAGEITRRIVPVLMRARALHRLGPVPRRRVASVGLAGAP